MKHRVLSLALAGLVILATVASAFAQVAVTSNGRVDQIVGLSQTEAVPAVASGTFVPQVKAVDFTSASMGTTLVPYVQDLDAYFATRFGWRPSKPATVLLYSTSSNLAGGLQSFTGGTLSASQQARALSEPAALVMVTQGDGLVPTNSFAILVNTDTDAASQQFAILSGQINAINASLVPGATSSSVGSSSSVNTGELSQSQMFNNAMLLIQESLAKQYANLMMTDLGGNNVPGWLRQGVSDSLAFGIVPGTPLESGLAESVARSQSNVGMLPTLSQINAGGFPTLLSTGGTSAAVGEGVSFLSARSLLDSVSGTQITSLLSGLGAGQNFESQLQSSTGFNLNSLNTQYQSLIPLP
ncbi:MAG: hypothetical protein M1380_03595 [Chloroflexi bacterium]|nr:hypothetical protein [Chloroflexota bacterium]